ncbi:peptidoglycan DD-metalloendopeptidase family protein [Microbacterium sp.]|uniref:peptidoglycan DD-metalloendopeptidase family protein n=1 Tax=Microbacterium sp. TaxID=51671 RepID=UPI003C1A1CC5
MLLRDLSDAFAALRRLAYRVDRLEGGAMLENSSITEGRMRFIGGLLRVDSGGRVEIVGTLQIDGTSTITGQFTVEGPWSLTGDGEITGTVTISGPVTISGDTAITGAVSVTGSITVDAGGTIVVGGMALDPSAAGGSLDFGSSRSINAGSGFLGLYGEQGFFVVNSSGPAMIHADGGGFQAQSDGPHLSGAAVVASTVVTHWLGVDSANRIVKVEVGTGGPGGGAFDWPFPESTIVSGFRTADRPTHDGVDFSYSGIGGDPIPASAAGTVAAAEYSSGYGNYVDLTHPAVGGHTIMTRYGHMQTAPVVSAGDAVAQGQTLGPVGNTGASFGDHLHWETWVDGEPIDPVTFMETYGE